MTAPHMSRLLLLSAVMLSSSVSSSYHDSYRNPRQHDNGYIGRGYYNLAGDRYDLQAELVCEFPEVSTSSIKVERLWRKVPNYPQRPYNRVDWYNQHDGYRGPYAQRDYNDWSRYDYDNSRYHNRYHIYTRRAESVLLINGVKRDDEGVYLCYARTFNEKHGQYENIYKEVYFFPFHTRY